MDTDIRPQTQPEIYFSACYFILHLLYLINEKYLRHITGHFVAFEAMISTDNPSVYPTVCSKALEPWNETAISFSTHVIILRNSLESRLQFASAI